MRIRVAQERDEKIQFLVRNINRAAFSNADPALHSRGAAGMTEGASSLTVSVAKKESVDVLRVGSLDYIYWG